MLIIVAGLPGSGKSYFASRLAQRLGARYISSDITRKSMSAMGKYAFEDKLEVYEEMGREAATALRNGETVVVDATFYHQKMRDLFVTLGVLLNKPLRYLKVEADEELIRERLRHPRLDSEADFSVYRYVRSQYEDERHDHLVIESTDDNIEQMLQRAEEYIKLKHD